MKIDGHSQKMNEFIISINNDLFFSDYPHIVSTTFFINYQGKCFPDNQWTDFTYPNLNTWTEVLLKNLGVRNVKFDLFFMDGPYKLRVHKDESMDIHINFINSRRKELCEFTAKCSYIELLRALHQATKLFCNILYEKGMNQGTFEMVYHQSVMSVKKTKKSYPCNFSKIEQFSSNVGLY